MVGYNNSDDRVEAVDLRYVHNIRFSFKHKDPNIEKVLNRMDGVDPKDLIPEKRRKLIYKGPAVFRCRAPYIKDLISMFGEPDGVVDKDVRSRAVFRVQEAEIWPETLAWLSGVPGHDIRIVGPEGLTGAVKAYFEETSKVLLNPRLPSNRPRSEAARTG